MTVERIVTHPETSLRGALATKQSIVSTKRKMKAGLLRCARNDGLQTSAYILAARCARALRRLPPSTNNKRAQGKPGVRCTRGLVCNMHKKRTRAYRFSGGNPAFPAQWVTAYSALSPVTGLSCHRHPREVLLPVNLTPASGRQDHTASPSARVTLVSRNSRVHRIPPRVRDDRDPPLSSGETREAIVMICPTG
jgi:hypothetical protein